MGILDDIRSWKQKIGKTVGKTVEKVVTDVKEKVVEPVAETIASVTNKAYQTGEDMGNKLATSVEDTRNKLATSVEDTVDDSYTLDDMEKIDGGASVEEMAPNDSYMEQVAQVYNKQVEENNKAAENQAAAAGAQYRELNRYSNELNKANGKAETGYADNVSIDAYNAYRNSVNKAYSSANESNNDLYSYYLQNIMNIQAQQNAKENADRDFALNKEISDAQIQESKNESVLAALAEYDSKANYYSNGSIKDEAAQAMYNYVVKYYGGEDKIPSEIMATLHSVKGFSEWFNLRDNKGQYASAQTVPKTNEIIKIDENGKYSESGVDAAVLNSVKSAKSSRIKDIGLNNFTLEYGGGVYSLETGKRAAKPSSAAETAMNSLLEEALGRKPIEGDCCYYNGVIYIVCTNGSYRSVEAREWHKEDYTKFVASVKKQLGVE